MPFYISAYLVIKQEKILTVFMGNAVILLTKALCIVAAAAEAYMLRNLCNTVIRIRKKLNAAVQSVLHKILEGCHVVHALEYATAFTLAYMRSACDIIQANFLGIILMNIITESLYTHLFGERCITSLCRNFSNA